MINSIGTEKNDPGVDIRVLLTYELKERAHKVTDTAKCYRRGKLNYTEFLESCLEAKTHEPLPSASAK
jgi:hypothetical protein